MTWTQSHSGRAIDLLEPRVSDISAEDIAYHLSRTKRFAGACDYTNAQHSLLVASIVWQLTKSMRAACHGLVHDGHETYTGDVIGPMRAALKQILGQPFKEAMSQITRNLDAVIFEALELYEPNDDGAITRIVVEADRRALFIERHLFLAPPPKPWPGEMTDYETTYRNAIGGLSVDWNRTILTANEGLLAFRYMLDILRHKGQDYNIPADWRGPAGPLRYSLAEAFPGLAL